MTTALTLCDRARGALLGLACGDAVGAQVEFMPRDTYPPVRAMVGGGPHGLRPGEWTDDTSMAACLAESLVVCGGHDPLDQLRRYTAWHERGHLSPKGWCFDIGGATGRALADHARTGAPYRVSDGHDAGNGSLMRLAPIALAWWDDPTAALAHAALQSRTTHAHPAAEDACRVWAWLLVQALGGADKASLLAPFGGMPEGVVASLVPEVRAVAAGGWRDTPREAVKSGGYVVDTLAAAMWCFARKDSFEACVLEAANLGHDADTTGAVAGQLAGAHWGEPGIPAAWREQLWGREYLAWHAEALVARGEEALAQPPAVPVGRSPARR
jgi:ADP-ribosyl-[dinitrogen reductase] hydrolase